MPTTDKVEVVYFPKMCCGQPIVVIKKLSGMSWMECHVSQRPVHDCNNGKNLSEEQ